MAPLTPHWVQPSHPDVQEVIINEAEFSSKSISKVALPPFAVFAKFDFPPCTPAYEPTYATVQMGRDQHLNLNSDLLYINHSCDPSLFFDTGNLQIITGPNGLQPGDELTFFYPSTEWHMAQPFDCLCGSANCRGRIAGAKDMSEEKLLGAWLNGHIRELLDERRRDAASPQNALSGTVAATTTTTTSENGVAVAVVNGHADATDILETADKTADALRDALVQAEKVVEAARFALLSYVQTVKQHNATTTTTANGLSHGDEALEAFPTGSQRRGPTSRELAGEMGGDTSIAA